MQLFEKEELKEIATNPIWFVELRIEPSWQPNLTLQYFGNNEKGGFN